MVSLLNKVEFFLSIALTYNVIELPGQMAPLLFKDLPKTRKKAEGLTVRTYVARSGTVMEFSSKT